MNLSKFKQNQKNVLNRVFKALPGIVKTVRDSDSIIRLQFECQGFTLDCVSQATPSGHAYRSSMVETWDEFKEESINFEDFADQPSSYIELMNAMPAIEEDFLPVQLLEQPEHLEPESEPITQPDHGTQPGFNPNAVPFIVEPEPVIAEPVQASSARTPASKPPPKRSFEVDNRIVNVYRPGQFA